MMGSGGIMGGEGGWERSRLVREVWPALRICRQDGSLGIFRIGFWVTLGREGLG